MKDFDKDKLNENPTLKDLQEFPAIFTFKIVGENNDIFTSSVKKIFDIDDREVTIVEKPSSGSKFISFSVTTIILTYNELEKFYTDISKTEGIRFYV